MNERQWELYRQSVVEALPESPLKNATLAAIQHRLDGLDRLEDEGMAWGASQIFLALAEPRA
jgi:hypothetical protein